MTDQLRTLGDYEQFIYTIADRYPAVRRSTLQFIRRGATLARVTGELYFEANVRLAVLERLIFDRLPGVIDAYGYEVWRGEAKLYSIPSLTRMRRRCRAPARITSTSRRASDTTAFRRRSSASPDQTCRCSSAR